MKRPASGVTLAEHNLTSELACFKGGAG